MLFSPPPGLRGRLAQPLFQGHGPLGGSEDPLLSFPARPLRRDQFLFPGQAPLELCLLGSHALLLGLLAHPLLNALLVGQAALGRPILFFSHLGHAANGLVPARLLCCARGLGCLLRLPGISGCPPPGPPALNLGLSGRPPCAGLCHFAGGSSSQVLRAGQLGRDPGST